MYLNALHKMSFSDLEGALGPRQGRSRQEYIFAGIVDKIRGGEKVMAIGIFENVNGK